MITIPAPQHQVYDVINETVEANESDPALWYPEGHMPELVRRWPLMEDVIMPNPFAGPAEDGDR